MGETRGFTLIELLLLQFLIGLTATAGLETAERFGVFAGIVAGITGFLYAVTFIILFWVWSDHWDERRHAQLRADYPGLYRVLEMPRADGKTYCAEGASIVVGDTGWEAEPLAKDELLYLQGLTEDWLLVWHAGFQPEQVEYVGPKPSCQYDLPPRWAGEPPPCPYPAQSRGTGHMERPYPSFFRKKPLGERKRAVPTAPNPGMPSANASSE